jgi:hypothetical protein
MKTSSASQSRRFPARLCRHGGYWLVLIVSLCAVSRAEEVLYNGIRLPAEWPPRNHEVTAEPAGPPPYLLSPPDVIPIDVGRQLFTDDFLIEQTTLRRVFHRAEYYTGNPVLKADRWWEHKGASASAMVYSDGVWYDPGARLYKMWYRTPNGTAYATSIDGVHWVKPELDVVPGTNIVLQNRRDSSTTWLDFGANDPEKKYQTVFSKGHLRPLALYSSPDGIHWRETVANSPPAADRTTFFWNPFRKVWVVSLRDHTAGTIKTGARGRKIPGEFVRFRSYREGPDLVAAMQWRPEDVVPWAGADRLDPSRLDLNVRPELYNLDAVAYESVLVGLFSIWRGQPDDRGKPNDIVLGFSRDGFHWDRPSRKPFLPVSERRDDWNWANVQSAGGGFLVVGDRLFFYVSGRTGGRGEIHGTGLATLRRDGFASMEAGDVEGTLTTRPLRFKGSHLFVNADSGSGILAVELLGADGRAIPPFSKSNCLPVHVDSTLHEVRWKGGADLTALAGQVVRVRFHLRGARLYSFWISPSRFGASGGYIAAGGPGFTAPVDTAGSTIYRQCCAAETNH